MKTKVNAITNYIKNNISFLCISILVIAAIYEIGRVDVASYQVFKDGLFFKGSILLLVAVMIIRKVKLLNIPIIATALTWTALVTNYLYDHNNDWGEQWREYLILKAIAYGLMLLIVVNMIQTKSISKARVKSPFFWIVLITFCGAYALEPAHTLPILCPILILYLTPIEKEVWHKIEISVAIGVVLAFTVFMIQSLVQANDNYIGGRWYGLAGIAQNGAIAALAFSCLLFLLFYNIRVLKKWYITVPILLECVFCLYILSRVWSRSGIMAAAFVIVIFALLTVINTKKRRAIFFSTLAVLGLVLAVAGTTMVAKIDAEGGKVPNFLRGMRPIAAFFDETIELEAPESLQGSGRFWIIMDQMTSGRVSIWSAGVKQATLLGKNDISVSFGEYFYDHMHNSFMDWIVRYGWIVGILLNVWFVMLYVKAVWRAKNPGDSFLLFSTSFFLAYAMFDIQGWIVCPGFLLLLLQKPLLTAQEKEELPCEQ